MDIETIPATKRGRRARAAVLWARQDGLDRAAQRWPSSERIRQALEDVNTELYALGEI